MSPDQPSLRPFPGHQALTLLVAGVLLYLVLGWLLLTADRNAEVFRNDLMAAGNTLADIRLQVERLQESALLAAATGEPSYADRHGQAREAVRDALDRLGGYGFQQPEGALVTPALRQHLQAVLAIQAEALALAGRQDQADAWTVLRGPAYAAAMADLRQCLEDCGAAIAARGDARLAGQRRYTVAALWCVALFAPGLALVGGALLRRARRVSRANIAAQAALADSERRFRAMFEQAAVGLAQVGLDGGFLRVNARFGKIVGVPPEDLSRLRFAAITHPDDLEADLAAVGRLLSGEIATYSMDKRYLRPDGSEAWVTLTVALVRDEAGKPLYFISVIEDIGPRRAAEQAARESARTVSALLDATSDRVFLADASGRLLAVNAAAAKGVGLAPEAAVGRNFPDLFGPDLAASRLAHLRQALETGAPVRFTDERAGVIFDHIVAPLPSQDGGAGRAALFARDATDLIRAREAAEAASRAKSEFLANMSHEIRTPLNGIVGMAQVLAGLPATDEQRECLDDILSASGALLTLFDDLLELARLEAELQEPAREPFVLATLVEAVGATLGQRVEDKGLAFVARIDPDVPELLLGDGRRLRQALLNLAGNAVKFTDTGSVRLTVSCSGACPAAENGATRVAVSFAVADTGIGIPPRDLDRIFEIFTQADGSVTRRFGGTGLGLAIARRLVRLMGGDITVESEPGKGSVFAFTVAMELPSPLSGHTENG